MENSKIDEALSGTFSRRNFIVASAALGTASACSPSIQNSADYKDGGFRSDWNNLHDRVWIGEEYWANPLQDWAVKNGRVETVTSLANRNLHLLTHQMREIKGAFTMEVSCGATGQSEERGSVGFLIGIKGLMNDNRNALMNMRGGLVSGVSETEGLFIGDAKTEMDVPKQGFLLRLVGEKSETGVDLTLSAFPLEGGAPLATLRVRGVKANKLAGNIALATNHFYRAKARQNGNIRMKKPDAGMYWFSEWRASGEGLVSKSGQTFGPILFTHVAWGVYGYQSKIITFICKNAD